MGASQSCEDLETSDSDEEYDTEREEEKEDYEDCKDETPERSSSSSKRRPKTPPSLDGVEAKLEALKLKYPSAAQNPNTVKLYHHIGGNTPNAKWVTSEKFTSYSFIKTSKIDVRGVKEDEEDDDVDKDDGESETEDTFWALMVGSKIRVNVFMDMQLKTFKEQRRVDFVAQGVWALKFFSDEDYKTFVTKYEDCLFENTYGYESNEANKLKVYGKDFIGWAKPEAADNSMWEDADDSVLKSPSSATPIRADQNLTKEFEEEANVGIQSLALGALDNSFLVSDSGVQVVKNYSDGIHRKGGFVNFIGGNYRSTSNLVHSTPQKALFMRAETNMLLMSPMGNTEPHTNVRIM